MRWVMNQNKCDVNDNARISASTHWAHDFVATSNQRQWRWFDDATTSCAQCAAESVALYGSLLFLSGQSAY